MSYIYFSAGKDGYFNYRRVPTQQDAEEWHNINFTDKVYEKFYHDKPDYKILRDEYGDTATVLKTLGTYTYQAPWLLNGEKEEPDAFARRVYALEEHHRYSPEFFEFFHDQLPF